jgi:CBS domain-containing membrane protein
MHNLTAFLKALYPRPMAVSASERIRGTLGGAIGIAFTAFISLLIAKYAGLSPWLVAPLGASAVLVFAVPSSPLAQPWSVVGGNTVSAIMGLLAYNLIPDPVMAASVAVGLAIGAMFALRCLHPPGGAMALLVVLTHTHNPVFALFPALTNSVLLVGAGLIYNNLTKKAYPHSLSAPAADPRSALLRVTASDFSAAIAQHNEVLDIAPDDLERLLALSEMQAYRRMAGHLTCADIMTPNPKTVQFGTELLEAWTLLQKYDIKALPVVDRLSRIMGLVTPDDFVHHSRLLDAPDPQSALKMLLKRTPTPHSDKPEVVGQIMTDRFSTALITDPADQLMPLFDKGDRRHVMVIDEKKRLCGIISASDLMRALYHRAA